MLLRRESLRTRRTPSVRWTCGSELAGQRAAVVMSLVQSAKLNGHDPHAYLKDMLERLPTHPASRIEELLPHLWQPPT
jgi:transposase